MIDQLARVSSTGNVPFMMQNCELIPVQIQSVCKHRTKQNTPQQCSIPDVTLSLDRYTPVTRNVEFTFENVCYEAKANCQ